MKKSLRLLFLGTMIAIFAVAGLSYAADPRVTTYYGDPSAGGSLRLQSTKNATKGKIYFGAGTSNYYDEVAKTWTLENPPGGGSMTYPGAGVAVSTGSAWGTSLNITAISDSTSTTSSTTAASATAVKAAYDLANGRQPALSLLAGTYTNGYYCTYASSGTLLNCNTQYPIASGLVFGSDAQGDIPVRGASVYGRLSHPGVANYFLYTSSTTGVTWMQSSANMQALLASVNYEAARTNLGLVIGTDVQAALTYPVTGVASPTAGQLVKWGASGNTLVDGLKFGTMTDTKYCTYTTANGLICTSDSGSMAYPGAGVAVSTGSAWGTSLNITAISDSTSTTSSTTASSATAVKSAYDLAAGRQVNLGLIAGTLTNSYLCTYTSSGTLLDCNTNPATFQAALTYPVTGVASPTAGQLVKWGASGNTLVDGLKFGTMTDTKYCTYTTANGLICTSDSGSMAYPGAGVAVSTGSAWGTSLNITAISDSTSTTSSTTASSATAVKAAYDLANGRQVNLSLAAGTYTNGYYCTYASSGTLLNCNTQYTTASNLVFGSDAQYDIPMRGASTYGRLAMSLGMSQFLGLGVTVSGNDVTFPGSVTTTAADNSRKLSMQVNTGSVSPTGSAYEQYIEGNIFKFNQNGTEYASVLGPSGANSAAQITFTGPTAARQYTIADSAATILTSAAAVTPAQGGTGVANNAASTLTISGNYATTLTVTNTTSLILPTSGTLQTTTGTPAGFVIASQATGDLLYASSSSAWSRLGIQAAGYVLAGGSTPGWSNAPQITTIELGAATDTTIARASAGVVSVEGLALSRIVASGTLSAHDEGSISSGACSSAVDGGTATGVATTDRIIWNFNGDPTGITGFAPSASGGLFIYAYPTSDHVNFKICNNTAGAVNPGAITLNWMVLR